MPQKVKKTKFVRTKKDQTLKDRFPETFKDVYYALRKATDLSSMGVTSTELFLSLDKKHMRKDIREILDNASWVKRIQESRYVFNERSDGRKKTVDVHNNTSIEREFYQWLSNIAPQIVIDGIKKAVIPTSSVLMRNGVLTKPILQIDAIGKVEMAKKWIRKLILNKRQRDDAEKLMTHYLGFLRERRASTSFPSGIELDMCIKDDWIRFDFTNADQFERTVPVYCSINKHEISGRSWSHILVSIVDMEISNRNRRLKRLYTAPLSTRKNGRPFIMKEKIEGLNCLQLSNGHWINVHYSIPRLMEFIKELCLYCGYGRDSTVIFGKKKGACSHPNARLSTRLSTRKPCGIDIHLAEAFILSSSLRGATIGDIITAINPKADITLTRGAIDECPKIVTMPDSRYVHVDSFVDLDDAKTEMARILASHFKQFGGYSNKQLLFNSVRFNLAVFLNDNSCADPESVYAIAQYLFNKRGIIGEQMVFHKPHIFETESLYPKSLKGLMMRLADNNGGILRVDIAKDYLERTMLSYSSLNQLLQIGHTDTFLIYDRERYLLKDRFVTNENWILAIRNQLEKLFRIDSAEYVIPRRISSIWLDTLPMLSDGLCWNTLLLQEVLRNFVKIGFRTISSNRKQSRYTIAAAIVPESSPLRSFPDVVSCYISENFTLPHRISCEDLWQELGEAGIVDSTESTSDLPIALNDFRFEWSDDKKTVIVLDN